LPMIRTAESPIEIKDFELKVVEVRERRAQRFTGRKAEL
jgi:hypothetical protein